MMLAWGGLQVEAVPDSTYDMIGGLDKQVREIKEVRSHTQAPSLRAMPAHFIVAMLQDGHV
jgi:hypothetical protein